MGSRRRGREMALQVLYQLELAEKTLPAEALRLYLGNFSGSTGSGNAPDSEAWTFCERLVTSVHEHLIGIDNYLRSASQNWRIERMAHVDRSILRLATYELLCERDTPASVIIDEAIELAKRFGSDESSAFVNGILDSVARAVRSGQE